MFFSLCSVNACFVWNGYWAEMSNTFNKEILWSGMLRKQKKAFAYRFLFVQISWFRPNSSHSHLTLIAIGDILFSEYATIGRYNLVSSSSSSTPRLLISNVSREDQGIYACKSSSSGQHSIKLLVNCMYFSHNIRSLLTFMFSASASHSTISFTSLSG